MMGTVGIASVMPSRMSPVFKVDGSAGACALRLRAPYQVGRWWH